MKIRNKAAFLFLTMIAEIALTINPALAHRFNVALVIPLSKAASVQGRQIRKGFMLATTERDGHPDQESDGHLGGLDVYVAVIDERGDVAADIGRIATQGEVDIVAAFGSEKTLSLIRKLLDGKKVALLLPGLSPFSKSDLPAVAAFTPLTCLRSRLLFPPMKGHTAASPLPGRHRDTMQPGASMWPCGPRAGSMTQRRCFGFSVKPRAVSLGEGRIPPHRASIRRLPGKALSILRAGRGRVDPPARPRLAASPHFPVTCGQNPGLDAQVAGLDLVVGPEFLGTGGIDDP